MFENASNVLLRQVQIVDPVANSEQVVDVLISANHIQAIEPQINTWPEETVVHDAQGLVIGPGLVDLYSTSSEPGHEERETLASLSQAAIAGGFTRLTILPKTTPAIDSAAVVNALQQQISTLVNAPQFSFWGAMTKNLQAQQMAALGELAPLVVGFSDGHPLVNLQLQRRLLEYLQPFQKTIALEATNLELRGNGVMREGVDSIRLGLPGDPETSETIAIATLLAMVATMKVPVHLMRVSTQRGVEMIATAQQQGLSVTASTTWMHLLFDTAVITSYSPHLRISPPLGTPSDRTALIDAVKAGVIGAIAVDHQAHTYEDKNVGFALAPPGAIGLELALPLLWQNLVINGPLSAAELWRALSAGPLQCLGRSPITVAANQPAELVLFDPQATWTVNRENLRSLSDNTPWFGQTVTGQVLKVWH